MNRLSGLMRRSVPTLVRFACILALIALVLICTSVLVPGPLPVILAMSAGHAVGGAAFALYLLAVLLDATTHPPPRYSEPPRSSRETPGVRPPASAENQPPHS